MNPSGDYVDKVWGENKWAEGSVGMDGAGGRRFEGATDDVGDLIQQNHRGVQEC